MSHTPCHFSCQEDARKSLQDLFKTAKYHTAGEATLTEVRGYASKGRPKKGSEPSLQGVRISAPLLEDPQKIATALSKKEFFVLSTKNVDDASPLSVLCSRPTKLRDRRTRGVIASSRIHGSMPRASSSRRSPGSWRS